MLEIILGLSGAWILLTGKLPGWLANPKNYSITSNQARLVGLLLLLPLPVSLLGYTLGLVGGAEAVGYGFWLEIAIFVLAMMSVLVLLRRYRIATQKKQNATL